MAIRPKLKFLLSITFILGVFSTISCEKEEVYDPAKKFVGRYIYVMTYSGGMAGTVTGAITIERLNSDRIAVYQDGNFATNCSVSGNTITEEYGHTAKISISNKETGIYEESSTGILEDNVLTIIGTWKRTGHVTIDFKIVCNKVSN